MSLPMIDHITMVVKDYEGTKRMLLEALKPLGYELIMELSREQLPDLPAPKFCGLGAGGKPDLWIRQADEALPTHIAFLAPNRAAVDAFYRAAIAAGMKDHGKPGPRPEYHAHYYGAFALTPDGFNIEAVVHKPD